MIMEKTTREELKLKIAIRLSKNKSFNKLKRYDHKLIFTKKKFPMLTSVECQDVVSISSSQEKIQSIKNQIKKDFEEKNLKLLEKKVFKALKGESKETIRRICNRIGTHISEVLKREKRIKTLNEELLKLKTKR